MLDMVGSGDLLVAAAVAIAALLFAALAVWQLGRYLDRRDERAALREELEEWIHGLPNDRYFD